MKKLFISIVAALLPVMAWGQSGSSQKGVVIAEQDWTGVEEFTLWSQFADGQEGSVVCDPDGLAITVGTKTGERWQPQTIVLQDGFKLYAGHDYIIRFTAKIPTDGKLQANLGGWDTNDQNTVEVKGSDKFQEIDIEFPDYKFNTDDNYPPRVLFQNGDFLGTSIVKKVQVIDLSIQSYEGVTEYPYWFGNADGTDATISIEDGGLAINNPRVQGETWTPSAIITESNLTLQKDHNYIIRLTMKVPSNGTYEFNLGSWEITNRQEVSLNASDDWQVIDVEFSGYTDNVNGDGFIMILPGKVAGKTLIKDVQLIDKTGNSGGGSGVEPDDCETAIAEKDWTSATELPYMEDNHSSSDPNATIAIGDEGLEINNPANSWHYLTTVITDENLTFEQDMEYIIRITMKIPSNGSCNINVGNSDNYYGIYQEITAGSEFQTVDFKIHYYGENLLGNGRISLSNSDIKGTTVIQKVEVIELGCKERCATPEISLVDGKIQFSCATKNVDFISDIKFGEKSRYYNKEIDMKKLNVMVYAWKDGMKRSHTATKEITIDKSQTALEGDLNNDGKVNAADHVKLSNIIMNKK